MPLVRIVIPTYNRAYFLEKAMESVLIQSLTDFEVIIVDDGSTDHTEMVVKNFLAKTSKIRYIKQENSGVSCARNRAVDELGEYRYVAFLDSDDVWHAWHLERAITVLEHEPHVGLFCGRRELVDKNGFLSANNASDCNNQSLDKLLQVASPSPLEKIYIADASKCFHAILWSEFSPWTSSVVVRRDAVLRPQWFNPKLEVLEDTEFYLYLATRCSFAFIDAVVGLYRRHEGNLTESRDLSSPVTLRRQRSVEKFFKIKLGMCQDAEDRKFASKEIAETTYLIGQCCAEQLDFTSAKEAYLESLRYELSLKSLKGYVISNLPASVRLFLKKVLTSTAAI